MANSSKILDQQRINMPAIATAPGKIAKRADTNQPEETGPFTEREASALFEETAQFYLGISGAEFLRNWDAKAFGDPKLKARAERVAALIPLIRNVSVGKKAR